MPERGSSAVAAAWLRATRRVSSLVLYPEARAALARAERMRRIPSQELARVKRRVDEFWEAIDRIQLTAALAGRAGDLAEQNALRAYDAVHLASVASIADRETVLVAADAELIRAARAFGIATVLPS